MKEEGLLSSKLYIAPEHPGMVHRPRLESRIDAVMSTRLILISAPAGFGKTSLLREWLAGHPAAAAWVSLDKGDNDPARFLRYLIAAIHPIAPAVSDIAGGLLNDSGSGVPEIVPLLTLLVNELAALSGRVIIILDDYHVIENTDIHSAVSFLVENAPLQVHIIISTRSDPPLPLARWRVRGQMEEIRGDDLRFSDGETKTYLQQSTGQVFSDDDVAALEEKTEGWAAGLQLAVLSMQGRPDMSGFIRRFSGSHRYIMDYLIEEVLNRQTEDTQAFLLRTSVLERLSGELCDAVTGQSGGRRRLESMENANMFLLPLDDERRWYRYHHLFADLLQSRLRESNPGLFFDLHRRAAQWYEENDMLVDAIAHSQTARDHQRTARLMEKVVIPLITRGELTTLLKWSEQLPQETVRTHPYLCLYLGLAFIFAGRTQEVVALLEQAENSLPGADLSEETRDLSGIIAALRAFMADMHGDAGTAIELAGKADGLLAATNLVMRSVLPFVLSRSYRLKGEMDRAIEQLRKVAGLAKASGNILTLAVAYYELAAVWKIEGKLTQADEIYQDTLRMAEEKGALHFGSIAKILAGMSDLLRERNDLDAARIRITQAIDSMKSWRNPTDLVIAYLTLSRIQQAGGTLDDASATLEKAEQLQRYSALFPPLGTTIETDRVIMWLARGDIAAAGRWAEEYHPDRSRPLIVRELEQITLARVYLRQGKPSPALGLLAKLQESAERGGRFGKLIEILVLQALAYKAQDSEAPALAALEKALYLAEPEGYVRIFVDVGLPMAELLYVFKNRRLKNPDVRPVGKDYLNRLLAAFPDATYTGKIRLAEGLSEREIEILRLMASGMTNRQIASELFITPGTVKAHTASIYRKLDAGNRTRAIALARELKLL